MADAYYSALSRPWDDFDAYLFDIDGTLLRSEDAVHYFAFCEALEMLSGRPMNLDGVVAHGNTDVGILRDALELGEVAECVWRPRLGEACGGMGRYVQEHRGELRMTVLPEVRRVLEHLRERGAVLGVATGNLRVIGEEKLRAAGIAEFFTAGSYSDAFEFRREVFGAALASVRDRLGADAAVCVLGDTPEDVRSARTNAVEICAVATGIYSYVELLRERPAACCRTLADLFGAGPE